MSLARQIASVSRSVKRLRRDVVPTYEWATIDSMLPVRVVMDSDSTGTPIGVVDVLVPDLTVGDRVEVRRIGSRRDITGKSYA